MFWFASFMVFSLGYAIYMRVQDEKKMKIMYKRIEQECK